MNNMINAIIVAITQVGQGPRCVNNETVVVSTRNYVGERRNAISDKSDVRLRLSAAQI